VYPQVLKIAVNFSRQHSGQNALREMLGPLVQKVLNDKTIMFETNPIDIYTSWINKLEMTSGTARYGISVRRCFIFNRRV
jgi:hypothetical protein